MKRLILYISLLAGFFIPPVFAHAATDPLEDPCLLTGNNSPVCQNRGGDPITGQDSIMIKIATIIAYITGLASVVMVIIGSIKYMTATGDPGALKSARATIIYSLIGIAVTLLAQGIIKFVVKRL